MISIILGTRPEIIKMAPVIRACQHQGLAYTILHTGQHYSYELDRIFFKELELSQADYNLDVGSGTHAVQTAKIMEGVERILLKDPSDIVLVQGDTNTVMAAALAAAKLHIPVGHVEAGLRSFDRTMPEEINRVVADHLADYLFAPTPRSEQNLLDEGIGKEKIFVTGNTIVDTVFQNEKIAAAKSRILEKLGLSPDNYILATVHRAENVDTIEKLQKIFWGLSSLNETYHLPVIFPMHPRTRKMMEKFSLTPAGITVTEPQGYLDFLILEQKARLILTDSGGVQEEACILKVPCVTLRENTERPETISVGANMLAGTEPDGIIHMAGKMMQVPRTWENPYGDGMAGERIVEICSGL